MAADKIDINNIPYDAPLSFTPPSWWWCQKKSRKGLENSKLTDACLPDTELDGKWVIISGSNNGIGRCAALKFAKRGANIILACRDPPKHETHPETVVKECQQLAAKEGVNSTIEWWEIDMANISSIEAFAARWLATERPIDILCNNAGMGGSPLGARGVFKTKDGFEIIHQVNLLSHVLLTLRLLPSIQKASEPRIVCTTSCFHYPGRFALDNFNSERGDPALPNFVHPGSEGVHNYQNNKLWYQIWLTELQHRLLQHDSTRHITVNGVHPGFVQSGIWNLPRAGAWLNEIGAKSLAWAFGINPEQGCYAIVHAALSTDAGPDKSVQGVGHRKGKGGGRYFNRIWEDEPMPHTKDRDCRLRVWRKLNDELKLQEKGLLDLLGLDATDV